MTQQTVRHPALERLNMLAGEWTVSLVVSGQPVPLGRTSFDWVEDGAFLKQYTGAEQPLPGTPKEFIDNSPLPVTMLIGLDDSDEQYTMLYADGRNVFRVYRMTLQNGVWTQWRDAPGFAQRFTGTFSEDGSTINATWEKCMDGETWEHDFDLVYTKQT